ncbi:hypothetical protein PQI23_13335 [Leucobacter sp. USCH14]|uniref:phage tail tube protein n=1 Tax=Leucobacter sp. USCH14 TaxID=3024838 RepID=UPI00309FD8BC
MTKPNQIAPTRGRNASTYEWIFDVAYLPENPGDPFNWVNIPDITALAPNSTATTTDGATYANQGQASPITTGESFNLNVNVKMVTDDDGNPIVPVAMLLEAANALLDQDRASDRVLAIRYYHYKVPQWAYQFTADVSWTRANTGNTDLEFLALTLAAKGDRKVIPNPAREGEVAPSLVNALPASAEEGQIVRVTGTSLKGITGVTVGGVAAAYVLADPTAVYVTMPAGDPGDAPIVAKVSGSDTAPLAYTRA